MSTIPELKALISQATTSHDAYVLSVQALYEGLCEVTRIATQENKHRTIYLPDGAQITFRDWNTGQYDISLFSADWLERTKANRRSFFTQKEKSNG